MPGPPTVLCSPEYVSVGVNRCVHALSWSEEGALAYGAHHMAAIYDPKAAEVKCTVVGHTGMVSCVHWVSKQVAPGMPPGSELLITGSADLSLRVWAVDKGGTGAMPWAHLATLQGHKGAVTDVCVHLLHPCEQQQGAAQGQSPPSFLLVSTAGDSEVHVWRCDPHAASTSGNSSTPSQQQQQQQHPAAGHYGQAAWSIAQTLPYGTQIQHAVALTHLPHDPRWLLLATGGTDTRVHLHVRPPGGQFQAAIKLSGHENWVRSLDFKHVWAPVPASSSSLAAAAAGAGEAGRSRQVLLASASQDRYARIWVIHEEGKPSGTASSAAAAAAVGSAPSLKDEILRYAPRPCWSAGGCTYTASLEALLIGHEDWVHSVCWQPELHHHPQQQQPGLPHSSSSSSSTDGVAAGSTALAQGSSSAWGGAATERSAACLLTASMDRTMVLWKYEVRSGLWMNVTSLGDAGASCLGYFGGSFSPDSTHIAAHGFTGALHLWERVTHQQQQPSGLPSAHANGGSTAVTDHNPPQLSLTRPHTWEPRQAQGGHFRSVTDVCWGADGSCVASASCDQTARIFAPVLGPSNHRASEEAILNKPHWCEVARPQVHGHDFSCIAFVPFKASTVASNTANEGSDSCRSSNPSLVYVSGSEEKVLRVFEATQAFLHTLSLLRGHSSSSDLFGGGSGWGLRAFGASVGALGLTNKAMFEEGGSREEGGAAAPSYAGYADGSDFVPNAMPGVVREPPLEEHLAQNMLWPEVRKLYGHGDNLYCVSPSPDGALIASACVAKSATAALIWVWDTKDWKGVAQLAAHNLTVTQLSWSHSGRFLASASRDRSFSVFERCPAPSSPSSPSPAAGTTTAAAGAATAPGASTGTDPSAEAKPQGPPAAASAAPSFTLRQRVKVAHARVLWGICWSHDDALLATASRDNTVKLWETRCSSSCHDDGSASGGEGVVSERPTLTLPAFPCAVTALEFAPQGWAPQGGACIEGGVGESKLLALGLESGGLQLWGVQQLRQHQQQQGTGSGSTCSAQEAASGSVVQGDGSRLHTWLVWQSDAFSCHAAAVNALSWRPLAHARREGGGEGVSGGSGVRSAHTKMQIASCSDDHSVRVFSVDLGTLGAEGGGGSASN